MIVSKISTLCFALLCLIYIAINIGIVSSAPIAIIVDDDGDDYDVGQIPMSSGYGDGLLRFLSNQQVGLNRNNRVSLRQAGNNNNNNNCPFWSCVIWGGKSRGPRPIPIYREPWKKRPNDNWWPIG